MARVYILGAGTPTPTPERFGSACVVQVGPAYLLFDCGPATTHKLVQAGLWPTQVNYLFFTHHHFDHDVDYPCFLLCRWDQGAGQEVPLQVYGPPPTALLTERLLDPAVGAFSHDWQARIQARVSQRVYENRGGRLPRRPPHVVARDIGPGVAHHDPAWQVTAARAEHVQPFLESLAYRLDSQEGSVVITGDTAPCPAVIDLARGADVLLCMCWDNQAVMDANGESPGQCGTTGAARIAQEAKVRRLVLTHLGPHVTQRAGLEQARRDVAAYFTGEVIVAEERLVLEGDRRTPRPRR
jgi:ribonuclease Z